MASGPRSSARQQADQWLGLVSSSIGHIGGALVYGPAAAGAEGASGGQVHQVGRLPSMGSSLARRGRSSRGTERSRPTVYGCRGLE